MAPPSEDIAGGAGSIRRRLVLALGGLLLVASVAVGIATYRDVHHEVDELLDDHLSQSAALLVAQATEDLDELGSAPDVPRARRVAFQVWREGRLLSRSVNAPERPFANAPGYSDATFNGRRWRIYARPGDDGTLIQVAELHAVRDMLSQRAALRATAPFVLAVPVLALLAWLVLRHGLAPLDRLGRDVGRRGPEDLSPLRAERVPLETLPLVQAINQLLARVERSLAHERRLTADAAHELRTPIAAIRAQAQVAKDAQDGAERQHALEGVLLGCDWAARLAEQLLALARVDSERALDRRAADLRAATCEVLAEAAPEAIRRGVELELVDGPPLPAVVDAALWRVLVRNLVDNALRYGASGGLVRLTLETAGDRAVLEVQDAGPGVPAEQRARLGERFFRAADVAAPGSGLGLSIVARIAELHGGDVQFGSGIDGRGLGVRVTIDRRT
jgi:two-component system sensor histidine kinase QseC